MRSTCIKCTIKIYDIYTYLFQSQMLSGGGVPPLLFMVGGSESILGDSMIVAQKAAFYGASPLALALQPGGIHVMASD